MTANALRRATLFVGLLAIAPAMTACESTSTTSTMSLAPTAAPVSDVTKFSVAEYGVEASPRVTTSAYVPKGGGRAMVGKPYQVKGKWYTPKEDPGYDKSGLASWYGPNFHGRKTANGEIFDQAHLSAAHRTFPLPSYARVTNNKNGRSIIVRVNDRGPFAHGRIIDLSSKAADMLEMKGDGVAAVRVQYVGPAPVEGDDTSYLMASYQGPGTFAPDRFGTAGGTMVAVNSPAPQGVLPGVNPTAYAGGAATQPAPTLSVPPVAPTVASAFPAAPAPAIASVSGPTGIAPAVVPVGFAPLPEFGPLLQNRPEVSLRTPVASLESNEVPIGYRNIGLAYRGDRVIQHETPFGWILTGK